MAEATPAPVPAEGEQKKPARGRPRDEHAPPKPKNGFQQVTGLARQRIKIEKPELAVDLKGMAFALKDAWEEVPQAEKDRLAAEYEKAMDIWRPQWAAYKETPEYKEFFELKQDFLDKKFKKKLIKVHVRGKIVVGSKVRVGANFEHAYPPEGEVKEGEEPPKNPKNYTLKAGQMGTVAALHLEEAPVAGEGEKQKEGKLVRCDIKWEDGTTKEFLLKKYAGKLEDPDIPKRPKSGYMLFAGSVRQAAAAAVEKEGGGMGDIGVKISTWWNDASEAKKAEFAAESAKQKEQYDRDFLVYRVTDKFKGFENKKVNLESTQKLKKIQRVTMNDAPKRPPSGFSLWKRGASPKLMEENKKNEITMTMGELGKKLGSMWAEVAQETKDGFASEAAKMKETWEGKHLTFKKNNKYMKFLEERQKVKIRQNRMVNLREMPKKPKSVFALYSAEHKKSVPQGKGEDKGTSALKQKFAAAAEEEKATLAKKVKESEDKWKEELAEFKAGDQFKTYMTTETKVKKEFVTEAVKVMTIKFINAAPPAPPVSGFSVFIREKRKAVGEGYEAPKTKEAKKDEVMKFKGMFDKMDQDVKKEFDTKKKELKDKWELDVKEFMAKEMWQEYLKEAKRLRLPIKQLLTDKKAVKKLKNGMRFIPLPDKPETMPQKPPHAYKLFAKEKKKTIDDPEAIVNMWKELDEAGKKKYEDEAKELLERFLQDMKEFKAGDEGKAYFRNMGGTLRSRRVIKAKFTFLKDQPKKPDGALKTWLEKNFKKQQAASKANLEKGATPEKGHEIRKKLTDQWLALSPEEKEPLEKEAKEKWDKYMEEINAFKAGENWIKYQKAVKVKGKGKAKAKAKKPVGIRAPKQPEELPKKPRTAVEAFGQEEGNADMALDALEEAFAKLPEDRRTEFETQANEAEEKYKADLFEFNKSEKGMEYQRALNKYNNTKKLLEMKARMAKAVPSMPKKPEGMPEKPLNALAIFGKEEKKSGPALLAAFNQLDSDKKAEFETQAKEADQKYQEDLAEFQKSEAFKKYNKQMSIFQKRKSVGQAKARFLGGEPEKPKNAMQFFFKAKKDEIAKENPTIKGFGLIGKVSEVFRALSADEKEPYNQKAKEAQEEYATQLQEFHKTPDYRKFQAVLSKSSGKPKGSSKAKAKAGPIAPPAPADMPKKPPIAFFLFKMENRGPPREVHQKWLDLKAEGQEEWNKKYKEKNAEYDKELKAFNKTADGKKYNRLKAGFDKKQAEKKAKDRYLGGDGVPQEPKRPSSAYWIYCMKNRATAVKEAGTTAMGEVSKKLTTMWQECPKDEKAEFEKQALEAKEEYEKAMAEYKASDAVKKYDKAMGNLKKKPKGPKGPKAKGKAKGKKGKAAGPSRGGGAAKAKAKAAGKADGKDSDSDVMGSDSSNSSSSDSDSD